jgi:branched-chain amino acid transport system permease protein
MRTWSFVAVAAAIAGILFGALVGVGNEYLLFAGYTVLQFIVLATAWNILGGYCGYVNFGSAAFFAIGAYSTVAIYNVATEKTGWMIATLINAVPAGLLLPGLIVISGLVSALIGLLMGYLTLRLRGVFFSIATLALAVVLQTLVTNWDFVGGSRGSYVIRPVDFVFPGGYVGYLFAVMAALAIGVLAVARALERSRLGFGFAGIRDDEAAAEASGVPTLKLKLIATALSGGFMGMAGAPFPFYIGFVEPAATFGLSYAVNSIAMPMIGGTTTWVGPLVGAVLLGVFQQVATVTISSVLNLLIVGLLLIGFVVLAPNGIVGLFEAWRARRSP